MRRQQRCWLAGGFLVLATLMPIAYGNEAAPLAADPLTEKRMVAISEELRCLVCQNESLAGSRAELAQDLRHEIREMIQAGKSDEDIMRFMVDRYGDYVRYRPPLQATTWLLWFGPFLLMAGGLGALVMYLRRRGSARLVVDESVLSAAQRRAAEALLSEAEGQGQGGNRDGNKA